MKLKKSDIVDVIAPSSFPVNKAWMKGVQILEDWGLHVRVPKNMIKPWLYHAQTNPKRLEFLKKSFTDSESKAVWAIRGGYGLQKIMTPFSKTKIRKKLFIGFSDSTCLHLYLNSIRKMPSLHAPFLADLPYLSKQNLNSLKSSIFGETQEIEFSNLKVLNPAQAKKLKAPLIGGNLTLLSSSLSCSWFPKSLGPCFLFLEDINEQDYRVDRALHQLFFSGVMKNVQAIILGSFHPLKPKFLKNQLLKSFLDVCNQPILMGLPCGHKGQNSPLPLAQSSEILFHSRSKATLKIQGF